MLDGAEEQEWRTRRLRAARTVRAAVSIPYTPRRPEETALYRIVRDHLEPFLEYAKQHYEKGLPRYVVEEFRGYLRCGLFSEGFVRCKCDACGHDLLVALSCKGRGICPSCATRRMCNTAAHEVDRVLPNVPIRQWVLSLPFELRMLAAYKPDVLTAIGRFFIESIFVIQRKCAGVKDAECGAINYVQRFGGSVNLNVHFHALVLDGAFARDATGTMRFHRASPPTEEQLQGVARRVHKRALRWLCKRGYIHERGSDERGERQCAELSALDACARIALQGGAFAEIGGARAPACRADEEVFDGVSKRRFSATFENFNVHAAVCVGAHQDEARERLVRYCARPSIALDRISILADGTIAYLVKYPRRGATHRIMTPVEFLARLAALTPPPRYPLTRYHGVLAPHSKWRPEIIPRAPTTRPSCRTPQQAPTLTAVDAPKTGRVETTAGRCKRGKVDRAEGPAMISNTRRPSQGSPTAAPVPPHSAGSAATDTLALSLSVEVAFNMITPGHWTRLLDGVLLAHSPRVNWPQLLRRTHAVDVLECPKCHGRLRVVAAITDRAGVDEVLGRLGLGTRPRPMRARARDPAATAS